MKVVATFTVIDKRAGQLKDLLVGLREQMVFEGLHIEEITDEPVLHQHAGKDQQLGAEGGAQGGKRPGDAGKDGFVARAARKVAARLKK